MSPTPKQTPKQTTPQIKKSTKTVNPTKIKTRATKNQNQHTNQTSPHQSSQTTPNSTPPTTWACQKCKNQVHDNDKAVTCDCNDDIWYHAQCVHISDEQYQALNDDESPLTWVCKQCRTLQSKQNLTNQPKHFDEIIKVLLEDINLLKKELKDNKDENLRLSEIIVKKMEVIDKMEGIICNFAISEPKETCKENKNSGSPQYKPMKERENTDTKEKENQHNTPCALLIGDSLIREASSFLKTQQNPNIDTVVIPGGKIKDISKYLQNQKTMPKKAIVNIGSNNVQSSKTPNHVMRPIWLTIEANQKRFPETKWFVSSIPYREDCRKKFIDEVNKALNFMCSQLKINYIDNTKILTEDHLTWDGVHLTKEGSNILAKQVQKVIEQETPESDLCANQSPNSKLLKTQQVK